MSDIIKCHHPDGSTNPAEFIDTDVALIDCAPSPMNAHRSEFMSDASIEDLAQSLKRQGLLQPIVLRVWPAADADHYVDPSRRDEYKLQPAPRYEIVAGERRWRAAIFAGWKSIAARVRTMSDADVIEAQLVENMMREVMHELDEAEGYQMLMQRCNLSADDVASRIGKSRSYVFGRLKLLGLCAEARVAFRSGEIAASTALVLARIPGSALQAKALAELTLYGEALSVRRAAAYLRNRYTLTLDDKNFEVESETLLPTAGSCTRCPKRSGSDPEQYADIPGANVCTDPDCYADKKKVAADAAVDALIAAGKKVIRGDDAAKVINTYGQVLDSNYVSANEPNWNDPDRRSLREIADAAGIDAQTVLVQYPGDTKIVELYERPVIATALEEAGIAVLKNLWPTVTVPAESKANIAAQENARKKREQAQAARAESERIFAAVRQRAINRLRQGDELPSEAWRTVAVELINATLDIDLLAEIWLDVVETESPNKKRKALIDRCNLAGNVDLQMLILDCALLPFVADSDVAWCESEKALKTVAAAFGVSTDADDADAESELSARSENHFYPSIGCASQDFDAAGAESSLEALNSAAVAANETAEAAARDDTAEKLETHRYLPCSGTCTCGENAWC